MRMTVLPRALLLAVSLTATGTAGALDVVNVATVRDVQVNDDTSICVTVWTPAAVVVSVSAVGYVTSWNAAGTPRAAPIVLGGDGMSTGGLFTMCLPGERGELAGYVAYVVSATGLSSDFVFTTVCSFSRTGHTCVI